MRPDVRAGQCLVSELISRESPLFTTQPLPNGHTPGMASAVEDLTNEKENREADERCAAKLSISPRSVRREAWA
jgi:hypothetical protein